MKIADMHCDTIYRLLCRKEEGRPESLRENKGHLDLLRMKQAGYLVQNFAMFVELDRDGDPWERVQKLYQYYREELEENRELVAPVLRYSDIAVNEAAGKLSSMLTVEEGGVCKGDLDKLQQLYDMGVRMITLTWNFPNELGFPNLDSHKGQGLQEAMKILEGTRPGTGEYASRQAAAQKAFAAFNHKANETDGLTEKGREFVVHMEELGMIPDVSHLSDAGFYDVCQVAKKPFVASHSNARQVCGCVRNLTDDMIRHLAERGGVMGLNYCTDFLEEVPVGQANPGTIASIAHHAKHIVNVGGMEVLGLGSDFDGIGTHAELPGGEAMGALWEGLHGAGFTEGQLDAIFWKNVLRVYRDTLP